MSSYCRPDLSDLRAVVVEALNEDLCAGRSERRGRRVYRAWARDWHAHLLAGVQAPIRAALEAAERVHTPFT